MEKTIKISQRTHGRLKVYCAQSGETMQAVVEAAVAEKLAAEKRRRAEQKAVRT